MQLSYERSTLGQADDELVPGQEDETFLHIPALWRLDHLSSTIYYYY